MTKNRKAQKDTEVVESAETAASENSAPSIETGERNSKGWYVVKTTSQQQANATHFSARSPRWIPAKLFIGKDPESGKFIFLSASLSPMLKYSYENWRDLVAVGRAAFELAADPANDSLKVHGLLAEAEMRALPHLAEERRAEIEARKAARAAKKLGVKAKTTRGGDLVFEMTEQRMNEYVAFCISHPGSSLDAFISNLGASEIPGMPKVAPDPAEAQKPDGPLTEAEVQAMK